MTENNTAEPVISAVETVLDNGKFGTRTIKFETGLLARQAAGSVTAYLDDDTMLPEHFVLDEGKFTDNAVSAISYGIEMVHENQGV